MTAFARGGDGEVGVKICGVRRPEDVASALGGPGGGADWLGFVLFERSPRGVTPSEAASLSRPARARAKIVVLLVDPDDAAVDRALSLVGPDVLQLHGKEPAGRVAAVKARAGKDVEVWKALPVADAQDVAAAAAYEAVADRLLFDAKPPRTADRPGGHGAAFDWKLVADRTWRLPWLLAGGLTPENVATAVRVTRAPGVDVSSGVESVPGEKSPARIEQFLRAAKRV